jgi:hypothetical protein
MALITVPEAGDNGDIISVVKYNAKAGRVSRVDRENGQNNEVDITNNFKAVFDLENAEVGSIWFSTNGPQWAVAPFGQVPPPKPTGDYKEGVRFMVKLAADCGGDVRELASTAKAFLNGINLLHDAYLAGVAANPGKLPVVVLDGSTPISSGSGAQKTTNYQPKFRIVSWAPRPKDLIFIPRAKPAGHVAQNGAPAPATGGVKVGAPISGGQQAVAAEEDFG